MSKHFDIWNKVNSLQSSWVKKLYKDCLHKWKIIPLYQSNKTFGPVFNFHLNFIHSNQLQTSILKNCLKKTTLD